MKKIGRLGLLILMMATAATSVSWAGSIVAMKSVVTEYSVYQDVMNWNAGVSKMNYYTLNGETAFCVQAGRAIRGAGGEIFFVGKENAFDIDFSVAEASKEDSLQSKIAYLGYCSKESPSMEDYAFTQMMIWQTLPECDKTANGTDASGRYRSYFADESVREKYEKWKEQIELSIERWDVRPSFGEEHPEIEGGKKAVVEDENHVLKYYENFSYEKDGVKVSHYKGDNFITAEVSYDCCGELVIMNERELRSAGAEKYKSYAAVNYLYQTEMSQNMSVYGHSNPIGMEMGFRIKPIGELEIMKEAEGGFIEGISFVIKSKDGSYEKTVMTDEEGKFNLQNIPAGKYTVTETVPDGFVANQPQTVIIEAGKKNVIKFENRFQRGIINLEKRGDIFTGNASDEEEYEPVATEKGLEGAVYEVIACEDFTAYDGTFLQKSGDVADILTTDQTGKARSKELYLGRYTLREIKAPEGYQTDNTVYDVELTYDRDSLTVETSVKVRDDMKYGKMMMAYDFSPSVLEMSRDRIFPSVPKTGDERYLLLSVSGGLAAFAAIGVILMRRRYIK